MCKLACCLCRSQTHLSAGFLMQSNSVFEHLCTSDGCRLRNTCERVMDCRCRLFKLPGALETLCEDYGQVATYKGSIPGHKHSYELDDHHKFVAHKPMLVCGNTAAMVGDSWLGKHFEVVGNRDVHYGLFDCSAAPLSTAAPAAAPSGGGSCC
jgi:hypothetical protein